MRKESEQLQSVAVRNDFRSVDERFIVGQEPGPVVATIDLDHDADGQAATVGKVSERGRHLRTGNQDLQIEATISQAGDVIELVRRYAHRVGQVPEAVFKEVLRFSQCRDGARPRLAAVRDGRDRRRLRGLEVRPQPDVVRREVVTHAARVTFDARPIGNQRRRFKVSEIHEPLGSRNGLQ